MASFGVGDATGKIPPDILAQLTGQTQPNQPVPQSPQPNINNSQSSNNNAAIAGSVQNSNRAGITRKPFIFTSKLWGPAQDSNEQAIVWFCNPSEVQWKIPLRGVEQVTKSGRVTHNWYDPVRNTYYDEPELIFNMQTGNIMPVQLGAGGVPQVIPQGTQNVYKLLELIQQERILSNGQLNLVTIKYNSMLMPDLTLNGMFKQEGLSFTESAEQPGMITSLSVGFTVYSTIPAFYSSADLYNRFMITGFGKPSNVNNSVNNGANNIDTSNIA